MKIQNFPPQLITNTNKTREIVSKIIQKIHKFEKAVSSCSRINIIINLVSPHLPHKSDVHFGVEFSLIERHTKREL